MGCLAGGILCLWLFYLDELALSAAFALRFCAALHAAGTDAAAAELCESIIVGHTRAAGGQDDALLRLPEWVFTSKATTCAPGRS